MIDILKVSNLIDSVSDGKKFCFSRVDINNMMNCFGQDILTRTKI